MACYSPLKGFEDKENGGIVFKRSSLAGKEIEVACGQCIGCRIDRSQQWAARIVHEAQMHQDNCFVTLTYDSENVPTDGSLNKRHFQLFMKRLRKKHNDKKIRFFHCGEYGHKLERPHYHACLFGIDFPDRVEHGTNNGVIHYSSRELEELWGKGFCSVGELNYETAAYTSRYIMKKITGLKAEEHYERVDPLTGEIYNLEPEYITMSLRPGIGRDFYEKYKSDFFPADECPVPGRGVYKTVPRYYEKLLEKEDPDTFRAIKKRREEYRNSNLDEYSGRRLEAKYKVKKAQLNQLPRSL